MVTDLETYEGNNKSKVLIVDEHLCLKKTAEIGLRIRKLAREVEDVVKGSEVTSRDCTKGFSSFTREGATANVGSRQLLFAVCRLGGEGR